MARITLIKATLRQIIRKMMQEGASQSEITQAIYGFLQENETAIKRYNRNAIKEIEQEFAQYSNVLINNTATRESRELALKALTSVNKELGASGTFKDEKLISIIENGLKTGQNASTIVSRMDKEFKKATFVNETIVNTAKRGFNRLYNFQAAVDAGVKKFKYAGPNNPSHPLCKKYLNKILTVEEILSLRNRQIEPVTAFMGGYKCRHHLEPIIE